jgi:MEDS: MEthanogen/methylotroph, DcmR Sensory domain
MYDLAELHRLSEILASLTINQSPRRYSTVLTTGNEQLLLVRDGDPIIRYGIARGDDLPRLGLGLELIKQFVSSFESFRHSVLLYDNPILARMIEFQYLQNGLQNGERCMYIISEDDVETPESIRIQMNSIGINTSSYMKSNDLAFVRIADPSKDPQGFVSGCFNVIGSLPVDKTKSQPTRMVTHMKYQLNTREEIEGFEEFERTVESKTSNPHGSVLCSLYVGNYKLETHGEWARTMLQTHGVSLVVCSEKTMRLMFQDSFSAPTSSSALVTTRNEADIIGRVESEIRNLSTGELERDISEMKNEIDFLVSQVKADLGSYAPSDLRNAISKISLLKRKEEMMNVEYAKRTRST